MKILKYLLIGILLLVGIFLLFGITNKSVSYGHTFTVDKPVKEAWAVSQDFNLFDQWLEGFKSIELLSGEQAAVGSTYKVVVNPGDGQEDFEMTETIKSIKEYDHITMHFDSEMMDFDQTITFKESDGKTTVSTDSKVLGKGLFMRSMFALMEKLGGSFTTQEAKNMEALKVLIQNNTKDYYPVLTPVVDMEAAIQ